MRVLDAVGDWACRRSDRLFLTVTPVPFFVQDIRVCQEFYEIEESSAEQRRMLAHGAAILVVVFILLPALPIAVQFPMTDVLQKSVVYSSPVAGAMIVTVLLSWRASLSKRRKVLRIGPNKVGICVVDRNSEAVRTIAEDDWNHCSMRRHSLLLQTMPGSPAWRGVGLIVWVNEARFVIGIQKTDEELSGQYKKLPPWLVKMDKGVGEDLRETAYIRRLVV